MIENKRLRFRYVDQYGIVFFSAEDLCELILEGIDLKNVFVEKTYETEKYNNSVKIFDHPEDQYPYYEPLNISIQDFDKQRQDEWFIPDEYSNLDVLSWLSDRISTDEEIARVSYEYEIYEKYEMIPVLRFLIFFIETLKKNNVVYGVGRGSSVSSYILYLIGTHRIDSIKYKLDFSDFLE